MTLERSSLACRMSPEESKGSQITREEAARDVENGGGGRT